MLNYRKTSWTTQPPCVYTTLEQFTYILFICANQIKIARPLHDPGTGYLVIYLHHGSCTLQSAD